LELTAASPANIIAEVLYACENALMRSAAPPSAHKGTVKKQENNFVVLHTLIIRLRRHTSKHLNQRNNDTQVKKVDKVAVRPKKRRHKFRPFARPSQTGHLDRDGLKQKEQH
jgi:hypothetical protein